jgi:hypothetical protein
MENSTEIFGRVTEAGSIALFHTGSGEVVTRLFTDTIIYPIGSNLSCGYEHPNGIVISREDADKIGITIEDETPTYFFIRHNHDYSYGMGNRSYWFSRFFTTEADAVTAMISSNSADITRLVDEDGNELNGNWYRDTNVIEGGEAWSVGDTSIDMGDWSESVIAVECRDPSAVLDFLQAHPHTTLDNLEAAIYNLEKVKAAEAE